MVDATDNIWGNASHVLAQWQSLLDSEALQQSLLPAPEVAIFVDEVSAAARPLLGRGGTIPLGFQFETALQQSPWQDIAGIGAPVRVFLLSDLAREDFPFNEIKLAVFLNAFMLGSDLRTIVRTRLQGDGRTLAWLYAPGLLDADACGGPGACTPDAAASSDLIGLQLQIHVTGAPLATTFVDEADAPVGPALPVGVAGATFGAQLGSVSPWLACAEEDDVVVLGRYASGDPSVCWTHDDARDHSALFVGTPRPPTAFWRAVARSAGVHLYTDAASGTDDSAAGTHADAVEAAASGLLYHAGSGQQNATARKVTLPRELAVRSEWGGVVCGAAEPCKPFETPRLADGESILYWLSEASV